MCAKPKSKSKFVKKFRVKHGNSYCELNMRYHEKGVCIPIHARAEDPRIAVFASSNKADAAIKRTIAQQNLVRGSMLQDDPSMKLLLGVGYIEVEPFQIEVPNESES